MARILLFCVGLLMFCGCGSYSGQGGGGSEIASIVVVDGVISGSGVPNAVISLYVTDSIPDSTTVPLDEQLIGYDSLFNFEQSSRESMSLLCINRVSNRGFVLPELSLERDTSFTVSYGELQPLTGVIRLDSIAIPSKRPPIQVTIPGTNYMTFADDTGGFDFEGIPCGEVRLDVRFFLENSSVSDITQQMIDAHVSDTLHIGGSSGSIFDSVKPDTLELFLK